MIGEGGKVVFGRTKAKALMTNNGKLKDGITPLRSMEGVRCCIFTSLSIISFLSFLSISSSFLLNTFSYLILSFSLHCFLSFSSSFHSFSSFSRSLLIFELFLSSSSLFFISSISLLSFSCSSFISFSKFSLSFCSLF